jgi:hypothetical protein
MRIRLKIQTLALVDEKLDWTLTQIHAELVQSAA